VCTSPVNSIEVALIELQYALGDYYGCGEQDHDAMFNTLEPSLCELRKIAFFSPARDQSLGREAENCRDKA
jgi:hypothetical protein